MTEIFTAVVEVACSMAAYTIAQASHTGSEDYLKSLIAGSPVAAVLAFFLHKGYCLLDRHLIDMRMEITGLHTAINNNSRVQIAQMFASRGLFEDAAALANKIKDDIDIDENRQNLHR